VKPALEPAVLKPTRDRRAAPYHEAPKPHTYSKRRNRRRAVLMDNQSNGEEKTGDKSKRKRDFEIRDGMQIEKDF
jgi:hypothetical protein